MKVSSGILHGRKWAPESSSRRTYVQDAKGSIKLWGEILGYEKTTPVLTPVLKSVSGSFRAPPTTFLFIIA
jgi:hypothetical protein